MKKKYYKVVALNVSGQNKLFFHDEIVEEGNFPEGNAESLVKEGFLKLLTEKELEAHIDSEDVEEKKPSKKSKHKPGPDTEKSPVDTEKTPDDSQEKPLNDPEEETI